MNITHDVETAQIVWDMAYSVITGLLISLVCANLVKRIEFFERGFDMWLILYGFLCVLLVGAHAGVMVGIVCSNMTGLMDGVMGGIGMGLMCAAICVCVIVWVAAGVICCCRREDSDNNILRWLAPVWAMCAIWGAVGMGILVVTICLRDSENGLIEAKIWAPLGIFMWLYFGVRIVFCVGYRCLSDGERDSDEERVRNFKKCKWGVMMWGWIIGGTIVGALVGVLSGTMWGERVLGLQLGSVSGALNGAVVGLLTLMGGKIGKFGKFMLSGTGLLLGSMVGGLMVLCYYFMVLR